MERWRCCGEGAVTRSALRDVARDLRHADDLALSSRIGETVSVLNPAPPLANAHRLEVIDPLAAPHAARMRPPRSGRSSGINIVTGRPMSSAAE